MNAYAAIDAAYFAELDRAQAREAALERFTREWESTIVREMRLQSFLEIDEVMTEILEEIADDPRKQQKFGRALFVLWACGQDGARDLRNLLQTEMDRIVEREFASQEQLA